MRFFLRLVGLNISENNYKFCCAGRSEFLLRAEHERSEGGWSEEIANREGVASGSATLNFCFFYIYFTIKNIIVDCIHSLVDCFDCFQDSNLTCCYSVDQTIHYYNKDYKDYLYSYSFDFACDNKKDYYLYRLY